MDTWMQAAVPPQERRKRCLKAGVQETPPPSSRAAALQVPNPQVWLSFHLTSNVNGS